MVDRFQGDPKLTLGPDGSNMTWKGGQPVMDQGVENPPMIQLFTRKGWFGNYLQTRPENKVGSDWELNNEQAITVTSLNQNRAAGEKALKVLQDAKLIGDVAVSVKNPTGKSKLAVFLISQPENVLVVSQNGVNWQQQAADPAYLKVNQDGS